MTSTAYKMALDNSRNYTEMKDAESRLEQARRDFDNSFIEREEYIKTTEECIKIIHACSKPYSRPQ